MHQKILFFSLSILLLFSCKKDSTTTQEYNFDLVGDWKSASVETRIYPNKSSRKIDITPFVYEFKPNGQYTSSNENTDGVQSQTYILSKVSTNYYSLSVEIISKNNNSTFTLNETYSVRVINSYQIEITGVEKGYKKVVILNKTTTY